MYNMHIIHISFPKIEFLSRQKPGIRQKNGTLVLVIVVALNNYWWAVSLLHYSPNIRYFVKQYFIKSHFIDHGYDFTFSKLQLLIAR